MTTYNLNPLKNNANMYSKETLKCYRDNKQKLLELARKRLIKQQHIVKTTQAYIKGLESDIAIYNHELKMKSRVKSSSNE